MNTKHNRTTSMDEAIALAGGVTRLAEGIGVTPQAVSGWQRAARKALRGDQWVGQPVRISPERAVDVERLLGGAMRAEQLRPDKADFFAYLRSSGQ